MQFFFKTWMRYVYIKTIHWIKLLNYYPEIPIQKRIFTKRSSLLRGIKTLNANHAPSVRKALAGKKRRLYKM